MIGNSINQKLKRIYTHSPPLVEEAVKLQKILTQKINLINDIEDIHKIAGADLAVIPEQKKMICGIIVYSYPDLVAIEKKYKVVEEKFPYVPGLLAFREAPAVIETFQELENKPDILIMDGHGIAHPRGFGIACHVGVLLDLPCFGIGKKKLYGEYEEPGLSKGSLSYIRSKKDHRKLGAVLRMKDNVKPVFISVGNKIDLSKAVSVTLECDSGYRIPVPTREADKYVAEIKTMLAS